MTVAPNSSRMNRQALVDLVVALVALPLLVVLGLMLESNMRGDWTLDADTRWHVLGLGLALLFISLLVMGYVTHRLGICIWQASQTDELLSGPRSHRANGSRTNADSQLHLVVSGELPPSYESVVTFDNPPPYCSVLVFDEKINTDISTHPPKQLLQQSKQYETSENEQQTKHLQTSILQSKQTDASEEQRKTKQNQSKLRDSSEEQTKEMQASEQQNKQSAASEEELTPREEPREQYSPPSTPKGTRG